MIFQNIYNKSPFFLQNFMISTYGIYWKRRRFGGVFKKYVKKFKERESFTYQQWRDYQTIELRKLLIHAFNTVPYYHRLYKKHGFRLSDFSKFEIEDLKKLPYLEKDEMRKFDKTTLLSTKRKRGTFFPTSGSTGTPISVFYSPMTHQIWNAAFEARIKNWAGIDYKIARGMIGGRRILPNAYTSPPYYRYNLMEKQTYFSAYHISLKTAPNYLHGIIKNNVEYMMGNASSNYSLANFIKEQELKAPRLKAVLTSSDKLIPKMREVIEGVYKCKVYDAYSGVESCGLISENKDGDLLFSPDVGIMETVDEEGKEVQFGESGEVIATGLLNFDQPLIRYRIGDRVRVSSNQNIKSGLEMLKIDEIEGRMEDIATGKDGRKMVRFHSLFTDIPKLVVAQLVQNTIDISTINLVVEDNFSKTQETEIKKRLQSQLGEVSVKFNYMKEIPRASNGKFKAVISHVKSQ